VLIRLKIGKKHVLAIGTGREQTGHDGIVCALVDTDAQGGPAYLCAWEHLPREDIVYLREQLGILLTRTLGKPAT
jgi:hypothetical protein